MPVAERLFMRLAPTVNCILRPLGLMLWGTWQSEDDDEGMPIMETMRFSGVRISRAVRLRPPEGH